MPTTGLWATHTLTHYLGPAAGAPSAASRVPADGSHEPGLQQLLSPGVQAVQLLHGPWRWEGSQVSWCPPKPLRPIDDAGYPTAS